MPRTGARSDSNSASTSWRIVIDKEDALTIADIHDKWAESVKKLVKTEIKPLAKELRAKLAESGAGYHHVGVVPDSATVDYIEALVEQTGRNRNFILRWALEHGLQNLKATDVRKRVPEAKPSLSLIALIAIERGIPQFEQVFLGKSSKKFEVALSGAPLVPQFKSNFWRVLLTKGDPESSLTTATILLDLRDAWAKKIGAHEADQQTPKLRDIIASIRKDQQWRQVPIGVQMDDELRKELKDLADSRQYSQHHVGEWAIKYGAPRLKVGELVQAAREQDARKPTLSFVSAQALRIGMKAFAEHHPDLSAGLKKLLKGN